MSSTPDETAARVAYIAQLAQGAMEHAEEAPPRPMELTPRRVLERRRKAETLRKARGLRARERRRIKNEQFDADVARRAVARGDGVQAPPRTPPAVWQLVRAITRDTSPRGVVVMSSLSRLPLELRHAARRELAKSGLAMSHPVTRYRVALLVGLSMLATSSRSTRAPRVVAGFCRGALCGLLRSPLTGRQLSISRVYGRDINGAPIEPWLVDVKLVHVEQPGLGAKNVPRGIPKKSAPQGHALNVYYLEGEDDAPPPCPTPRPRPEPGSAMCASSSAWALLAAATDTG